MPEIFLKYRLHGDNTSLAKTENRDKACSEINRFLIKLFTGYNCSEQESLLLAKLARNFKEIDLDKVRILDKLFKSLLRMYFARNCIKKREKIQIIGDTLFRSYIMTSYLVRAGLTYEGLILSMENTVFLYKLIF
jgi:hypothetical protein